MKSILLSHIVELAGRNQKDEDDFGDHLFSTTGLFQTLPDRDWGY